MLVTEAIAKTIDFAVTAVLLCCEHKGVRIRIHEVRNVLARS